MNMFCSRAKLQQEDSLMHGCGIVADDVSTSLQILGRLGLLGRVNGTAAHCLSAVDSFMSMR